MQMIGLKNWKESKFDGLISTLDKTEFVMLKMFIELPKSEICIEKMKKRILHARSMKIIKI